MRLPSAAFETGPEPNNHAGSRAAVPPNCPPDGLQAEPGRASAPDPSGCGADPVIGALVTATSVLGSSARWSLPSGGFRRKQDAQRFLVEVRQRLAAGEDPLPSAPCDPAFDEVVEQWWEAYAEVHVSANTRRAYRSDVRQLTAWFGSEPIDTIDLMATNELIARLVREGASPQTVRHWVNRLYQILRWAHERQLLAALPPRPKTPRVKRLREPMPLTAPELEALLEETPAPWGAYFAVLALHGLRPNEGRALRWHDLAQRRIFVEATLDSVQEEHEPKAGSRRSIPLDPVAADLLRDLAMSAHPSHRVFAFLGEDLRAADLQLRAALRRADVAHAEERILYDLRHTYASIAITLGVRPATLAKPMGNSVKVCMDTYVRWWEQFSPDADVLISASLASSRRFTVGSDPLDDFAGAWKDPANQRAGDGTRTRDPQLGRVNSGGT